MLEVASESTGSLDVNEKRDDYARLGIPEYWRFDAMGQYHGARLAGDRLVDGVYVPIQIDRLADGVLQGHSAALNLLLRSDNGALGWYDPATGEHIATFDSERARADREWADRVRAEVRADREQAARMQEQAAREQAEARVRELEEQLQRLRGR